MNRQRKILVLSANPLKTSRLRLDKEVREISEGLKRSKHRDNFIIEQQWAVRLRDLRRALLDNEPDIVHFCGHGNEEGLCVENEQGDPILVSSEAITELFELFNDRVECVILNACYTQSQAEAISKHINYVIGMSREIKDGTAIEFAIGFYDALGAGESFEKAFRFGRNAVAMDNIPESSIPILKKSRITLLNQLRKGYWQKKRTGIQPQRASKINIGMIPIILASVLAMTALQQIYDTQKSTLYLVIGFTFFLVSGLVWGKASSKKENKMKTLKFLSIILSIVGLATCSLYLSSPSQPVKNKLLHIFENRALSGSMVLVLWEKSKGNRTLIKGSKGELKIEIFKKSDDNSIEIIYKPEIDSSGVTVISELPEGEYCVGISFNGIILDYVEHVRIDNSRIEFIELINKSPSGIVSFEAVNESNKPLNGIIFEIWTNMDLPFRGGKTRKNGQTNDMWIYSLTDKSIGSYYAVAEIEDEDGNRHQVWRSKPFRPFFKYAGDKSEVKRAVIKLTENSEQ